MKVSAESRLPTSLEAPTAAQRAKLLSLLERHAGAVEGSLETPVPGLFLSRLTTAHAARHVLQQPAFGLIAQGAKTLLAGGERHAYDPFHYLVSSVHLPVLAGVTEATTACPYLGLRLELDAGVISELIPALGPGAARESAALRGIRVSRLDHELLDAVLRLLALLDTPQHVPVLAPLIRREIFYRLLIGEHGESLRQLVQQDSQTHRIARAISHLREHYHQPLRIEALARSVHMSNSSLHHHFKAVTAMTPLQFQKQLRLQEARRLMLAEGLEVGATAHRVGYESASQFSREYRRLFGRAPAAERSQTPAEAG